MAGPWARLGGCKRGGGFDFDQLRLRRRSDLACGKSFCDRSPQIRQVDRFGQEAIC